MTPIEKAKELVDKMYYCQRYVDGENYIPLEAYKRAKQCALIAVDITIKSTFSEKWYEKNKIIPADYLLTEYWEEVKQEIENF
jgi:hypothetical protein